MLRGGSRLSCVQRRLECEDWIGNDSDFGYLRATRNGPELHRRSWDWLDGQSLTSSDRAGNPCVACSSTHF
jgi:hypothetical protein